MWEVGTLLPKQEKNLQMRLHDPGTSGDVGRPGVGDVHRLVGHAHQGPRAEADRQGHAPREKVLVGDADDRSR